MKFVLTPLLLFFVGMTSNLFAQSYCPARGNDCGYNYIANVQIGEDIDNQTPCTNYGDYTKTEFAIVQRDDQVGIVVTWGGDPTIANYAMTAWVDWNGDKVFDETNEVVALSHSDLGIHSGTMIVPADAPFGETRIRIRMVQNAAPAPCGDQSRGEVEDYAVYVYEDGSGNITPSANDDEASGPKNVAITIKPLENDADPDGSLEDSTLLIRSGPFHGKSVIKSGSIEYTPDLNYIGDDTITYTINDDAGDTSNEATIIITLVDGGNSAPIVVNDSPFVFLNTTTVIDVLANDLDPEDKLDTASLKIIDQPLQGTAEAIDGKIEYTPNTDYLGKDSLRYEICDADSEFAACSRAYVIIEVTDQLSIDNQKSLALEMYPNPTSSILRINTSTIDIRQSNIRLLTSQGAEVQPIKFNIVENNEIVLIVDELQSGMYLIIIKDEFSTFTGNFLKK